MNIFLDKTLPKRTQILLQVLRVMLLVLTFGSIFLASIFPTVGDVMLYSSVGLAVIFLMIKIITDRRKKRLAIEKSAEQN